MMGQPATCSATTLVVLVSVLLICHSAITAAQAQKSSYFSNIPGDYCEKRLDKCCLQRMDDCSVPILGTRCYCDEFCNRKNPDCCPDYGRVCLGAPPPPLTRVTCTFEEDVYQLGQHQINCNECECREDEASGTGVMSCSHPIECLVDPHLLDSLPPTVHWNSARPLHWIATNYSMFWGKGLHYGIVHRTGTQDQIQPWFPIHLRYDKASIPAEFDARTYWAGKISRPRDQGWCGSSWAFSTIAVASDRLAIESDGHEVIMLSPQNLISCDWKLEQGCEGGYLERAWHYLRRKGVVDEGCYPYTSESSQNSKEECRISSSESNFTTIPCDHLNEVSRRRETLYHAEPAYRIKSRETDIQYEIMSNGPVQAKMRVEQDFFYYRAGIYSSSGRSSKIHVGSHSVRLIGWGEEISNYGGPPVKYWLASNSWGEDWGEKGLFRIVRGTNESGIEELILTVRMGLLIEYEPDVYSAPSKWFYSI